MLKLAKWLHPTSYGPVQTLLSCCLCAIKITTKPWTLKTLVHTELLLYYNNASYYVHSTDCPTSQLNEAGTFQVLQ